MIHRLTFCRERREEVRAQAEQRIGLAFLEDFLRQQRDLLEAEVRLIQTRAGAVISWSTDRFYWGLSRRTTLPISTSAP
ncbi:MAG: hypothetical protein V4457_12560 [Pseudomonadota bacterium]